MEDSCRELKLRKIRRPKHQPVRGWINTGDKGSLTGPSFLAGARREERGDAAGMDPGDVDPFQQPPASQLEGEKGSHTREAVGPGLDIILTEIGQKCP